jgi:hypothetical protein
VLLGVTPPHDLPRVAAARPRGGRRRWGPALVAGVAAGALVVTAAVALDLAGDPPARVATSPAGSAQLVPPDGWTVDSTTVDDDVTAASDYCSCPVWAGSTPDGTVLALSIAPAPVVPHAARRRVAEGEDGQLTLITITGDKKVTVVATGFTRPDLHAVADTAGQQLAAGGLDVDALPLPDDFQFLPPPGGELHSPLDRMTVRTTNAATGHTLEYRYAPAGSSLRRLLLYAERTWVADGAVHGLVRGPAELALVVLRPDHDVLVFDASGADIPADEDLLETLADTLRPAGRGR